MPDPSDLPVALSILEPLWWAFYLLATGLLLAYGAHAARLLWWSRRRGPRYLKDLEAVRSKSALGRVEFPKVLVQLPVFNEPRVVQRLVEAACSLDWPRDALEVQLLDDSTDGSEQIGAEAIAAAQARGVRAFHLRRSDRRGYKAGALAAGLSASDGEFVAIFDADFVPERDFLRRGMALFGAGEDVGCVQGRWGHLNRDQSFLTRAQAVQVDAHFHVQQLARAAGAGFLNFNGSAGIWRRSAIEESGGWSSQTLTEDLDLSYRAQLRGWRFVFDPSLVVPAELPPSLAAYKAQQRRWATGSLQSARLLLGPLWRSSLGFAHKWEGSLHLLGYAVCVAMVMLVLLLPLGVGHLVLVRASDWLWPLWAAVWLAALGPLAVARAGQVSEGIQGRLWVGVARASLLGLGTSANNAIAALRGLWARGGEFVRTPKQGGARASGGTWPRLEFGFGLFTLAMCLFLAVRSPEGLAPYLLFCSSGFWGLSLYWWRDERGLEQLS